MEAKQNVEGGLNVTECGVNGGSGGGIELDGFGIEIQGQKHTNPCPGFCTVYLENETSYRIRLYNTNQFSAMVELTLDEVNIGTFFLQPLSKYDIERPMDRPLAFVFNPRSSSHTTDEAEQPVSHNNRRKSGEKPEDNPTASLMKLKSTIVATFQPEAGSKTSHTDIGFPSLDMTHRVEIRVDISIRELYELLREIAGRWAMDPKCVLVTWYSAEYDSPAYDIVHINMEESQLRRSGDRKHQTPLKMSLLLVETLYISVKHSGKELSLVPAACPTVGELLDYLAVHGEASDTPLYLLSTAGRYLATTKWMQRSTFVAELFNKHEISEMPSNSLSIHVSNERPPGVFHVVCRNLDDKKITIEVDKDSTILQCRYQLAYLGGPESDKSIWIYGGELLENSMTITEAGLKPKSCVDVILRKNKTLSSLEMKDPIAVEGLRHINTGDLIRKVDQKVKEIAKRKKCDKTRKLQRGHRHNTILGGHVGQQFIEVNPIEVDERFSRTASIIILPKDMESLDLRADLSSDAAAAANSKSICTVL